MLTDVGPGGTKAPRDREASFEPQIVAKRQRRVGGIDDQVIPLVAKGLTTNEVQAHLAGFYGMDVSRETIATITGRMLQAMVDWRSRPALLLPGCPLTRLLSSYRARH